MSNTTVKQIIDAISAAETVLVCGHVRPDGDCVGSAFAVRRICEKLGKRADAVCDADKPSSYAFLPDYEGFCAPRYKKYDLFIAVDCANDKRLGAYRNFLIEAKNSICIDHHPNDGYGKLNYIRSDACSTCEIIFDLFKDTGLIDNEIATMLYTGLSTDTGHFMHSNTTSKVFETAAALSELGVDVGKTNHDIYCNRSLKKIKLMSRALDKIVLHENGRIALMLITLDDLGSCGCTSEDTEGLIDYASSISGVKISISMCEQQGSVYRVSLRSVSSDVSAVAAMFGGGGHKLAAGCLISGNCYDIMDKLINAARNAL